MEHAPLVSATSAMIGTLEYRATVRALDFAWCRLLDPTRSLDAERIV